MGEVEEQRYVCKFCSKRCVSGKSLGGHMRIHLAQISASKKAAAQVKAAEIEMECDNDDDRDGSYHQLKESCVNQSNSEEKINVEEFGDGDQSNNSYELRENPKKSWRTSAPKHALIAKTANSCRECGKEFASLRALSGHMRCHSIKNKKEVHLCKECGRGFDSMRAMFGHMKSHSKRVMKVCSVVESGESLTDLENFCPIRRKRSRIGYKGIVNPSFSGVDASDRGVSEVEEAARCLVMLSRGVGSFLKFDANAEDSDDDDYFGGVVTSSGIKKFCGSDGDFVDGGEKKLKKSSSLSYIGKNVSEFDDLYIKFADDGSKKFGGTDGNFVDDDEKLKKSSSLSYIGKNVSEFDNLDMKFDDGEMLRVENGMKVDLVCGDEFLESGESCFEKKSCENEGDLEMMEGFEKRRRQCVLSSQNGRQKMVGESSNLHTNGGLLYGDFKHDQSGGERDQIEQEMELSKGKERECPICFKVFASGQALGGHKRAHYSGVVESKNPEMLDLNFPVPGDAARRSGGGLGLGLTLSSWFVERSREHEALLLTT